jgi:RND family efflux transporter MFP subunit
LQELATRNNAAASRVEEAVSTAEATRQRLVQARVERDRTLYNIERSQMPAPFTGRVVERLVAPGEYAGTGTVVARLVDTEHLEVTAQAPVSVAGYVQEVTTLPVSLGGGLPVEADIRTIIPVGDQVTRTFEIRVALPEGLGIIGTPVRVSVPSNQPREVLAVPRDAIILRADGSYVFRVTEEDVAERILVEPGVAQDDRVEVRGALSAGDRVVVRGGERLQPGQSVVIAGDT